MDDRGAWLSARLARFADRPLRIRQLVAILVESPEPAAAALAALVARVTAGTAEPDAVAAIGCLVPALAELDYPARQALYEAAARRGDRAVATLILDAAPPTATADEVARGLAPQRPLRAHGRALTLGERKALARRPRGDALTELLRDPHPDVVAIVLDNPQLTEREAVRIAAARPAVPAALVLVANHRRWSTRLAVRRALVLNRYTPMPVALRLLVTLGPADWAEVVAAADLPEALRSAAETRLAARTR